MVQTNVTGQDKFRIFHTNIQLVNRRLSSPQSIVNTLNVNIVTLNGIKGSYWKKSVQLNTRKKGGWQQYKLRTDNNRKLIKVANDKSDDLKNIQKRIIFIQTRMKTSKNVCLQKRLIFLPKHKKSFKNV